MRHTTTAAAILAHLALGFALGPWLVDDGGIALAFARNIADGHGPVATVGGPVVEGFSSPAWVGALALAGAAGAPLPVAAKILGLLGGAVAISSALSLSRRLGATATERAVLGAFLGLSGPLALWSVSGLEGGLYAGALTSGVAVANPVAAAVALGVAAACRPEGIVIVAGAWLARRAVHDRVGGWELGVPVAVAIAAGAWRWTTFGMLAPNTAVAKLGGGLADRWLPGLASTAAALMWLGAWVGVGTLVAPRRARALGWPVALAIGVHVAVGGDWMRYGRLLVHVVPLGAVAGVPWLVRAVGSRWRPAVALAVVMSQLAIALDVLRRPPLPMALVAELAGIARAVGPTACGEATTRIAAADVGGLLWTLPSAEVLDLAHLVDPPPHEPWPAAIAARAPQLVVTHGVWVPRTGLTPDVLDRLGYRPLCARAGTTGPLEAEHPTTVWLRGDCTAPIPLGAAQRLTAWCRRPR